MSKYGTGLIGLDLKPLRKVTYSKRNRYRAKRNQWLFPALLALITLGIFVVVVIR